MWILLCLAIGRRDTIWGLFGSEQLLASVSAGDHQFAVRPPAPSGKMDSPTMLSNWFREYRWGWGPVLV